MTFTIFLVVVLVAFIIRIAFYQRTEGKLTAELQHLIRRYEANITKLDAARATRDDLERLTTQQIEEADVRNEYLDYVFRTFYLHLANPYVTRPTFEEARCYHCHYPDYAGHAPDCAWLHCRPLTEVLYPPAPKVPDALEAAQADIVLPAEPDEEPSPVLNDADGLTLSQTNGYGHGV